MTETNPTIGDVWVLRETFYSDAAETVEADPTTVALTIRNPAGVDLVLGVPPIVHEGEGVYAYDWSPQVRGVHQILWAGTGAVQVVEPYGINVRGDLSLTTDLVDLQTVRAFLRMPIAEDDQDPLLEGLIATASAHVMETYEQEFAPVGTVPETRTVTYRGGLLDLAPWSAQAGSITAVSLTPDAGTLTALAATDWIAPANRYGVVTSLRLPSYAARSCYQSAEVTALWGYPEVPEVVKRAACITVQHWHRTQVALRPSGFTEDDEGSSDDRVAIPQMARWLMRPFERMVVA